MAPTCSRAAGIFCVVLGSVCSSLGAVAQRPLDHRIKHFEPITLSQHHLRRSVEDPRPIIPFTVPVVAFNQSFDLELKPATHLFSDQGAFLTTFDADGNKVRKPIDSHGFYTGRLGGQPEHEDHRATFAHVAVHKDGSMQGLFIDKHGEGYHIDPASEHFDDATEFDHVVYKESDIEFTGGSPGGMPAPAQPQPHRAGGNHRNGDAFRQAVDTTLYNTDSVDPAFEALMQGKTNTWDGKKRQRQRRSDEIVQASTYVPGNNVCHVALWADKEMADEYGGESGAIVKMLQRFAIANQIFIDDTRFEARHYGGITSAIERGGQTLSVPIKLAISEVMVESGVSLTPGETAQDYLKTFGTVMDGQNTDWSKVCLAAGFTYRDYDGTLGLAWTASGLTWDDRTENYRRTSNGGICTAQYRNSNGDLFSTNACMVTSLNYGSKQPELQISLVLAHEFGHNFGSPHDATEDEDEYVAQDQGDNLMYPYSVTGAKLNNHIFSDASVDSISSAIGDAAGCFLAASEGCGNFMKDGLEECDCGGSDASCEALGDTCCSGTCLLIGSAECSPLDQNNGACCTSDCQIQAGVECIEQSVCQAASSCNALGVCGDPVDRPDNAICQQEVSVCETGRCSGLCNAGVCDASICALWGMVECDAGFGLRDGCQIKCKAASADDSTCENPADLGAATVAGFGATNIAAVEADYAVRLKAPGSKCAFFEGIATSGLCTPDGDCLDANTEEDLMAQMMEAYNWALETFSAWVMRTDYALPNYAWFSIGFVVITLACCGMCYIGNHPRWSVQLANCCGCDHHHKPRDDVDVVSSMNGGGGAVVQGAYPTRESRA